MPAAKTTADLRAITEKEFAKLCKLLEFVSDVTCDLEHDDTTIRYVIAHRAHWTLLFLGWYADGQAGKTVYFPAEGYKWSDLKRYNVKLREQHTDLPWDEVQKMLQDSYNRLIGFIDAHDDATLYDGPMKGANNKWTTGRWAEAAGASHYRSASKYVRAVIKAHA